MSNMYRVTDKGIQNLNTGIALTDGLVSLATGSGESVWTMQATFHGNNPVDNEGWAPWKDGLIVPDLIERGYIVEVADASGAVK